MTFSSTVVRFPGSHSVSIMSRWWLAVVLVHCVGSQSTMVSEMTSFVDQSERGAAARGRRRGDGHLRRRGPGVGPRPSDEAALVPSGGVVDVAPRAVGADAVSYTHLTLPTIYSV